LQVSFPIPFRPILDLFTSLLLSRKSTHLTSLLLKFSRFFSFTMDANSGSSSTLLTLPPDLVHMRSQFFSPDATISLTRVEFDKLWPYMNNIYTLNKRHPPTNNGRRSVHYNCWLFRTKNYTPVDIRKWQRNQSCCTAIGYPARLKVVFYGESRIEVSCQGSELHNHDLREIDAAK